MTIRKMMMLGAAALMSCILPAETISVDNNCKVAMVAYLNGYLQISLTGSTALTLTQCEISVRAHGSTGEWPAATAVTSAKLGPGGGDQGKGVYFSRQVALNGNVDVRFRVLRSGDASDWLVWENVRVEPFRLPVPGYSQSGTARNPSGGLTVLSNGKQNEIAELNPSGASGAEYLQLDYGGTYFISGLRVIPRLYLSDRVIGARIEVSDNADMSNAQTVIASTSQAYNGTTAEAVDWAFPEAVQGRYVRITAATSEKWIDFCELEAYSDRPDANDFSVTVGQSAYNSAAPKIRMSAPWAGVDSWTIERAFSSEGPWTLVTTDADSSGEFVDSASLTVAATYFYRVRFLSRKKNGDPVEITPSAVSYVYTKSLERDWATPTALYNGVSILFDCQANNPTYPTVRAFDGNLGGNFVATTDNPLIGLDLGQSYHLTDAWVLSRPSGYGINTPISFWGANETPTNTPAKQAVDDPHYTELSRNAEPGGGVFNHWYEFPVANPSAASYRYAFIHKNAADAATQNWGNVIEVAFYGYDDADAAAAQLIAPEQLTAVRTASGIQLAWTPGHNVTGYVLERRSGAEGPWTELDSFGLNEFGMTDTTEKTTGTCYFYRVRVTENAVTKYSPIASVCWYVAGDGTGLLATYSAPVPVGSCNPAVEVLGSETVTEINVAKAAAEAVYGTTADNVLVAWKGKLIVPFAGDYTFEADASDGFMLELDGDVKLAQNLSQGGNDTSVCSVLNDWKSTGGAVTTRTRAAYALTAGEHQIRAWWNPSTGAKSCVLKWALPGEITCTVIPVTQFKPAASVDPETYGAEGWRFRSNSDKRGYIVQQTDDAFTISDWQNSSLYDHGSFAWKKVSGHDFSFEANVFAPQMFAQYGYLFVSANLNGGPTGDGATLMLYRCARRDGVNVRYRPVDSQASQNMFAQNVMLGSTSPDNNNEYEWLKIVRNGNRFTLKARLGTTDSNVTTAVWQDIATYDDTEGRFGKDVYVGFGSTGSNNENRTYQARYLFKSVKLKVKAGTLLIFR